MKSLSSLGIGLSVVFGCLLLALIAEIYYLLWWKRRIINREEIQEREDQETENHSRREFFYLFCWKKPSSLSSTTTALNPLRFTDIESQTHCVKPYGDLQQDGNGNIETELMRLHSLSGPTRLLFTIKEETREDLESEDGGMGKFGSGRSDLIVSMETPYSTPLSSPSFFTPPMTPLKESTANCCYNNHGFNPLFESSTDVEIRKIKSSPPPKFKFLKDAEEKLFRKSLLEEEQEKEIKNDEIYHDSESENGSSNYITILVAKNKDQQQEPISSSSSSVAKSNSKVKKPLASSSCSSPSSIRSINVLKPMFQLSSKD
ncbi:hypothetical protein MKW98_019145 [Papaver atlanticum]|uniref:Uncharacterized protein n=1 Tax=Papaver atlanticum TaxID=357466 RepID=A0AAD4TKU1_9MAGN|nr:hypothetical protein MKW98_019145 [Papaver atlanticum]